ncbi:DUF3144 domain-containing protein [Methylophaga sp. OBS3]|uniref:DUF3144 domain-containing protein n=1 Tax=Methylophaga sp. OBS3 TaxID=2991934 RepID=UPI00224CD956|nr:DUF3144 domain-containing protein [Methylophaga sp. OBS3]MCX4189009.1 DUF3144 domain-containing protein [Methylophaga sp. OBS3]
MSENAPEKTFQQRCDEFIDLANQQHQDTEAENVNSALLFSAARFNVFSTAPQFESAEQLKEEKDKIIEYFAQRFAEMMVTNLDEYIDRFDEYNPK